GIATGHLCLSDGLRGLFLFCGVLGLLIRLDHAQRTLHLGQALGARGHARGIGKVVGERLDLDPRLAQGLVQLGLDPPERGVIDRIAKRSRHRAALSVPPGQAGSLKSATERRRSAASWARVPIDCAVWLAPCEVCAVIDWMALIA